MKFRMTLSATCVSEDAESWIRFGWSIPEANDMRRQMCGLAGNVTNIVLFNRFSGFFFGEGTPDVMLMQTRDKRFVYKYIIIYGLEAISSFERNVARSSFVCDALKHFYRCSTDKQA